jgi:signal transduction histidine kinase
MTASLRALYLHGEDRVPEAVAAGLAREFAEVQIQRVAPDPGLFPGVVASGGCDVVLADYTLPGMTGVDAWSVLDHAENPLPFVILAGRELSEAESIDVMRSGVSECILPEDFARLGSVVRRLIEIWEARQAKMEADAALVVSRNQLLRLTQQMHARIDEERTAVSREIHDDIGGALAAVKFDLAWIGRRSADPEVKDRVLQASAMLQQALEASQRIMLSLRPAILDEGLVPALQWMVQAHHKRTGAEVQFRTSREVLDLPADVQAVAYSVVREALTNVVKHAQATRVLVDVSDQEGLLTVEVTDNGKGLSPKALSKDTSFGILGLRERAQSVGGWLDVGPREGGGVSVILSVPLGGAEFAPEAEGLT